MKDILRQTAVILTILITLVVNGLANALPLNGYNTGQISDQFKVYFVPAGYVFAIWGVIYIALIAFAVFQALPAQRHNPRLRAAGWWIVLGGLANSAWIFFWHYLQFPMTLVMMLILLASLIVTYLKLEIGQTKVSGAETWAVQVGLSIYLGWITVATAANITDVLAYLKWDGFGIAPEIWMVIVLAAVLVIASLMILTRRDVPYALVILWALAGISIKFNTLAVIATPTWITFGLIVLVLVYRLAARKPAPKFGAVKAS
jgi:hypothetical protein